MQLLTRLAGMLACLGAALLPVAAHAEEVIAHRGVYHDMNTNQTLAENSYYAVVRAYDLGLRGIELDLRRDGSNTILVTHDKISNRATARDNANGVMNAVDVALNIQRAPQPIHFAEHPSQFWTNTPLKNYGRNSQLVRNHNITGDVSHMQSLDSLLFNLRNFRRKILEDRNFMVILDVQDPLILQKAADEIKKYGVGQHFYLKFFVRKALYNTPEYKYNGSNTCYAYARNNNLTGLQIIPQINDGELDTPEDDDTGIKAFQTRLTIPQFLKCWSDAQAQHHDAARMSIVSASVPADNIRATNGAHEALAWARANGRKTMTIVPNPDAGRMIGGKCQLFAFQATSVGAVSFNMAARHAKANFTASVKPDYTVWDVMGDYLGRKYYTDWGRFTTNLC